MRNADRYPFIATNPALGEAGLQPYLPLSLTYQDHAVTVAGLLDTGAMVNVLPYQVGVELGAVWEQHTTALRLTGNLAQFEARGLLVSALVGQFAPVRLAFAWTRATNVPILLGQVNFFMEFDVCFYRSQLAFEICPKERGT
ncbi:MAG: hypothetical protein ACRERD_15145 [Candidatus Binatia bacterium]